MTTHHSAFRAIVVALAASILLTAPAASQQNSLVLGTSPAPSAVSTDSSQRSVSPAIGPTLEGSRVAIQHQPTEASATAAAQRVHHERPVALMIVGGAAVLAGLVIDGDAGHAIAIGGVVVGLIGLYQYLQ